MKMNRIVFENIKDCNLEHIFECGQCFRWNREGERYMGVVGDYVAAATYISYMDCENNGTLALEVSGGDREFWMHYFDLDTDYSQIKGDIIKCEPLIQSACEYGYGIRILNQNLFETLISFVVSQNNNIPRIKKCIESICRKYGKPLGVIEGEERYGFPTVETLADAKVDDLAELKLGYRSEYIVSCAQSFMKGAPEKYEDVVAFHGIGPKVANCIRLFGLHCVDAFPIDTWVKHIMNDMYGFEENDVRGMAAFAEEKFGRYAGYAQQYLFYYYRDRK